MMNLHRRVYRLRTQFSDFPEEVQAKLGPYVIRQVLPGIALLLTNMDGLPSPITRKVPQTKRMSYCLIAFFIEYIERFVKIRYSQTVYSPRLMFSTKLAKSLI